MFKNIEISKETIAINSSSYKVIEKTLSDYYNSLRSFKGLRITTIVFNKINQKTEESVLKLIKERFDFFIKQDPLSHYLFIAQFSGEFTNDEILTYQKSLKEFAAEKESIFLKKEEENKTELIEKEKTSHEIKPLNLKEKHYSNQNRDLKSLLDSARRYDDYLFSYSYQDRSDLSLSPFFQRESVWTDEQKQGLILSILNNLPIGNFYINRYNFYRKYDQYKNYQNFLDRKELVELSETDNVVYDGKQRLSTIIDYLDNQFPIIINGEKYYASNLEQKYLQKFDTIVSVIFTDIEDRDELINFYIKINTTQTKHTTKDIELAKSFLQ